MPPNALNERLSRCSVDERCGLLVAGAISASRALHAALLAKVARLPMGFFDSRFHFFRAEVTSQLDEVRTTLELQPYCLTEPVRTTGLIHLRIGIFRCGVESETFGSMPASPDNQLASHKQARAWNTSHVLPQLQDIRRHSMRAHITHAGDATLYEVTHSLGAAQHDRVDG
jgi:hypothetical protein